MDTLEVSSKPMIYDGDTGGTRCPRARAAAGLTARLASVAAPSSCTQSGSGARSKSPISNLDRCNLWGHHACTDLHRPRRDLSLHGAHAGGRGCVGVHHRGQDGCAPNSSTRAQRTPAHAPSRSRAAARKAGCLASGIASAFGAKELEAQGGRTSGVSACRSLRLLTGLKQNSLFGTDRKQQLEDIEVCQQPPT